MFIKPALHRGTLAMPQNWAQMAHGLWQQQQEKHALAPFWNSLAGDYALQLGPLSPAISTGCKATELISVFPTAGARVQAACHELPFARRSIDIVVMAHLLDYAKDPHQYLREADRTLCFDGYMVITAANPWGLARLIGWLPAYYKRAPWTGRAFSRGRIEDWLSLLNYEVVASGYVGNRALWPVLEKKAGGQALGDNPLLRAVPLLRCSYYIVARKRVFPLTPSPGFVRFNRSFSTAKPAQARSGMGRHHPGA